uniref:protein cereblon isoform X1 n=1 Tax=Ciona intestinalis TaxID=7719 RepID=UPI000180D162|nr:protein cereblon isoform X1 [Ciona intestinalis]|eukprot:XP_002127932.1 protein cereblon isoform X1 [Ciona intestinalis]
MEDDNHGEISQDDSMGPNNEDAGDLILNEEEAVEEDLAVVDDEQNELESSEEEEEGGEMNRIGVGRWRNFLLHIHQGGHLPRFQNFGRWRGWIERHLRRNNDNSDPEDDDETENIKTPTNITFDKNLPTSHSYLGEMEDCSGVPYQKEDSYITMPIMYVNDFVLIPGQTLPLQIARFNEVALIQRVMEQEDKTFGVLTANPTISSGTQVTKNLYDFGCTAEIRSFRETDDHEVTQLRIVAVGRQRFQLMEKRTQLDGNVLAKVKIISDIDHQSLNKSLGLCRNCQPTTATNECGDSLSASQFPLQSNYQHTWKHMRRNAWSTSWQPWVHRMYDVDFLRLEIFKELREWNGRLLETQCPVGATDFSFWVVTMVPLSVERRLFLLQLQSAVQRLRCELNLLRKSTTLHCSHCSLRIAERKDVFSMSTSGPMAAYVNPGGVVHETLTLYKTTSLDHVGRRSTEHSWFPGYAWTICECRRCSRHMGWRFTATNPNLIPQKFWGLTRSALSPQVADSDVIGDDVGDNDDAYGSAMFRERPPWIPQL